MNMNPFKSMDWVERAYTHPTFQNSFVRYQGDEGWAPAMFLKRVDSGETSTSPSRKGDTLDIVSFNGGKFLIYEYFTK